jgi:hypothetical protein
MTEDDKALFSCSIDGCREEVSFPADMLRVSNGKPYCEDCYCELPVQEKPRDPSDEDEWLAWHDLPPFVPAYVTRIEALTAENERMREALRKCVMEAADWARQAGEAKGKLEGSEMPGIVDGWKAENQELRSEIARLRDAGDRLAVFVRHNPRCAITRGRDQCNCDHDIVISRRGKRPAL